jgi:ankyrin repeat protein
VARLLLAVPAARAAVADTACDGMAAMHAAAYFGHVEMVRLLVVEGGADVDGRDAAGSTPLHVAAGLPLRRAAVMTALLECGADLAAKDAVGLVAIDLALATGQAENVDCLRQWEAALAERPSGSSQRLAVP